MRLSASFHHVTARVAFFALLACGACALGGAAPAAPPPSTSRFIEMPPIDDGGKSSGAHAVTICLPAGYDATDRRYPVIYVLDGESAFLTREHDMRDAVGYELVHDQLVHEGLIEPAIFVAVHNSVDADGKPVRGNRRDDYCLTDQGAVMPTKANGYYDYLAHTIKPLIDATYRTRPEPVSTGITGFSAGGAGAFWMTYLHPETFGMGICQSPPFMAAWAGNELQAMLDDPKRPVPAVRLWMDAGSREFDFIYKDAYAAYRKLVAQGFRHGENIAFYTGHNHGHEKFDCNQRLRAALYFMLHTKTPTVTGEAIADMDAVDGGPITLARPTHVVLETVYDHGLRLTDGTVTFTSDNPKVAALTPTINELRPIAAGHTTVTATVGGRKIVQQVEVSAPAAQQLCRPTKTPIRIDGDLADWPSLPIVVDKPLHAGDVGAWHGPADLSYRFGCTYDAQFFYIAIQTTDDCLKSVPEKDPWFQDGVEVRLDARPDAERRYGQGANEFGDILLIALSPARAGETRAPYNAAKLPEGTKAVCVATPTGHNTEIAIPVAYLNKMAGTAWSAVRLNVVVNDVDEDYAGFRGDKLWWQPDWRTPDNTWGSGTFQRQAAAR